MQPYWARAVATAAARPALREQQITVPAEDFLDFCAFRGAASCVLASPSAAVARRTARLSGRESNRHLARRRRADARVKLCPLWALRMGDLSTHLLKQESLEEHLQHANEQQEH